MAGLEGVGPDKAKEVEALILATLEKLVINGVPEDLINSYLHQLEIGQIKTTKDSIKVAIENGFISLLEIKLPGKRKMDIKSLLNGYDFKSDAKML